MHDVIERVMDDEEYMPPQHVMADIYRRIAFQERVSKR